MQRKDEYIYAPGLIKSISSIWMVKNYIFLCILPQKLYWNCEYDLIILAKTIAVLYSWKHYQQESRHNASQMTFNCIIWTDGNFLEFRLEPVFRKSS